MRILVTGSEGGIGRVLVPTLLAAGHDLRTFDRAARRGTEVEHLPADLRDIAAVRRAVQGVDAVAHLGAIPSDDPGREDDVLSVNVQGTWNVLLACVEAGVGRVVAFSSVNALGNVGGHRPSASLPIDDAYPRHPMSAYQLSKHLGEEACRSFSAKHGLVTVCLRPVLVTYPDRHDAVWRGLSDEERVERGRTEYWAYVDARDVCDAVLRGLRVEGVSHDAFLLAAADTTALAPTAELVDRFYPSTPWPAVERDAYLAGDPRRSLIDYAHAAAVLGWSPRHRWRDARG